MLDIRARVRVVDRSAVVVFLQFLILRLAIVEHLCLGLRHLGWLVVVSDFRFGPSILNILDDSLIILWQVLGVQLVAALLLELILASIKGKGCVESL